MATLLELVKEEEKNIVALQEQINSTRANIRRLQSSCDHHEKYLYQTRVGSYEHEVHVHLVCTICGQERQRHSFFPVCKKHLCSMEETKILNMLHPQEGQRSRGQATYLFSCPQAGCGEQIETTVVDRE